MDEIQYSFVVLGNPGNEFGNPQPYFRQTQNSKWSPEAKRYHDWQMHVAQSFVIQAELDDKTRREVAISMVQNLRPLNIPDGHTAELNVDIWVVDEKHADADNIFKGILDSLFVNDKKVVAGSFLLRKDTREKESRQGQVYVIIKIKKDHEK